MMNRSGNFTASRTWSARARGYGAACRLSRATACAALALGLSVSGPAAPVLAAPRVEKDQARITGPDDQGQGIILRKGTSPLRDAAPSLLAPPPADTAPGTPPEAMPDAEGREPPPDDPVWEALELESLIAEEIPDVKAVELTPEMARRALDAFADIQHLADDPAIADYPTLAEYARATGKGREMEARIRRHGFRDIAEWNTVIVNLGFALTSVQEGTDQPILDQITAVENSKALPEARKKALIRRLKLLIPSENNRKVVRELMKDPAYAGKLKLLDGNARDGEPAEADE